MKEDYIKDLGYLALANRFKRISENMVLDGRRLYRLLDLDIEPNWFLIFTLLENQKKMSITELAKALKFSHPSVITLSNKMIKTGYLQAFKSELDNRKQMLELTEKGNELLPKLKVIWTAFENAINNLFDEEDQLLLILNKMEDSLSEINLMNRVLNKLN